MVDPWSGQSGPVAQREKFGAGQRGTDGGRRIEVDDGRPRRQASGGGGEGGSESSGATVEYYDPETRLLKKAEGVKQYGREEGIWTWYHENGVKQREQGFVAGLRTGPMTAWYDTGAVMARGSFEGDE